MKSVGMPLDKYKFFDIRNLKALYSKSGEVVTHKGFPNDATIVNSRRVCLLLHREIGLGVYYLPSFLQALVVHHGK